LITSVRIELFGCNWNCIYIDTTEIGKFHQKCRILKIQNGGRRHLGFYQHADYFCTGWACGLKFELNIPRHNTNWKISSKVENFENSRWRRPPSWICQNVNNFCMNWAIWLQFELHILNHDRNWKVSSQMQNFENQKWRPPPFWIYQNVNNFRTDWTLWLQFELHIPRHNRNWKLLSKCAISGNPRWRRRHLGFTKMLNTSAWIPLFGCTVNCVYKVITEIGKYHQIAAAILVWPKC
jgi:hypothetical protein